SESGCVADDGLRALDGARGTVKGCEETVALRSDLSSLVAVKLRAYGCIMLVELCAPVAVAHLDETFCRGDDVGEEHRRQDSVNRRRGSLAGQKCCDLVDNRGGQPHRQVRTRHFDERGAFDVLSQVAAMLYRGIWVVLRLKDQGRNPNERQHVAYIGSEGRAKLRRGGPWRCRSTEDAGRCLQVFRRRVRVQTCRVLRRAPGGCDIADKSIDTVPGHTWIVVGLDPPGGRVAERERAHPLWVHRCVHDRDRSGGATRENACTL